MSLKALAAELASKGRFGDKVLVHMHPKEVAGLASLAPGGRLPTNPHTGLPEAFFFLPFLSALAPAAAGAGAAAAGAAAAGTAAATGALGAGMAAGMTAATSALPTAAAAALPAATASALPAAAAALPAVAEGGIGALTAGASGLAGAGTAPLIVGETALGAGAGAITPALTGAAPAVAEAVPAAVSPISTAAVPAAAGSTAPEILSGGLPGIATSQPAMTPALTGATPATATAATEGGKGIGAFFGGMDMNQMALPAMMLMGQMGGGGGGGEDDEDEKDVGDLPTYEDSGGGSPTFPGDDYTPGMDGEWQYFKPLKAGGLVKGYAEGGVVDLMGGAMPGANLPEATAAGPVEIPQSPLPKSQIGTPTDDDKELIAQTVEAIRGRSPDPQGVILAFVQTFGEQALQDLVSRVQSGSGQSGQSDGMSDSIPATIDGQEPASLSQGEFVVPADVVSGIGNGDTNAGAAQLQGMMDNVRQMRTGMVEQPPAIEPSHVMPDGTVMANSAMRGGGMVGGIASLPNSYAEGGPVWSLGASKPMFSGIGGYTEMAPWKATPQKIQQINPSPLPSTPKPPLPTTSLSPSYPNNINHPGNIGSGGKGAGHSNFKGKPAVNPKVTAMFANAQRFTPVDQAPARPAVSTSGTPSNFKRAVTPGSVTPNPSVAKITAKPVSPQPTNAIKFGVMPRPTAARPVATTPTGKIVTANPKTKFNINSRSSTR